MIQLDWRPPYDWRWMMDFLGARTVAGIDTLTAQGYQRTLTLEGYSGVLTLEPDPTRYRLRVTWSDSLDPVADKLVPQVRRFLDLDCPMDQIELALGDLARPRPGLRLPGCMDPFEQIVRAVLGQLVSVAMAAKLTGYLVARYGEPLLGDHHWRVFPTPQRLGEASSADLKALGMSLKRAESIIGIARACVAGDFPLYRPLDVEQGIKALQAYPGIGRWTASYFALRGWQARDVFLADDYLVKQRFAGMTPAAIRHYAARWQPWRSYGLLHIWQHDGWRPDQLIAK